MNQTQIINPFHIAIDPMERLLLVNFEQDPDTTYVGFEPQVFDDPINGTGHLVIGWRQDGLVDVFHQPGLCLNAAKYDIAGKGLAHMVKREQSGATYEVNDFGVQAHYELEDIHNRTVVIHINEHNPKARKTFGLLAPMGDVAEAPSAMPLVLLHDFYFVRQPHTVFEMSIDGKRHQPDKLPIPMDFTRMYFTRYSPRPLIATLNPAFEGELKPVTIEVGAREIRAGDTVLALKWTADKPSLEQITRKNEIHPLELCFEPAFPDIQTLAAAAHLEGNFEIKGHPSTGRILGNYAVEKKDGEITITMIPSQGWQPRPTKFSLRFLYTVAGVFKKWPTTYEWTARLEENETGAYTMHSAWRRIKR
jgi:hypothetical protein